MCGVLQLSDEALKTEELPQGPRSQPAPGSGPGLGTPVWPSNRPGPRHDELSTSVSVNQVYQDRDQQRRPHSQRAQVYRSQASASPPPFSWTPRQILVQPPTPSTVRPSAQSSGTLMSKNETFCCLRVCCCKANSCCSIELSNMANY